MPELKQHLTELETDYRRVSAYFDDILTEHEKTFLSVRRNIEQSEERKLAEMEMKMSRPLPRYQRPSSPTSYRSRNILSFERSDLNPELPVYVSDKYRSVKCKKQDFLSIVMPETKIQFVSLCKVRALVVP